MVLSFDDSCDDSLLEEVGAAVENGKVVIFPTDTVYGLGTNPRSEEGAKRCFSIKKRELSRPLPILYSSSREIQKVALFDEKAISLASRFWPGKLTIVLPIRDKSIYPEIVTGPHDTIAVRRPGHKFTLRLIQNCGGSIIGTSANISGSRPIVHPDDPELASIVEKCDYFVKGECNENKLGLSSTIVDLSTGDLRITREGAIPTEDIISYLERQRRAELSSK